MGERGLNFHSPGSEENCEDPERPEPEHELSPGQYPAAAWVICQVQESGYVASHEHYPRIDGAVAAHPDGDQLAASPSWVHMGSVRLRGCLLGDPSGLMRRGPKAAREACQGLTCQQNPA